jgi:hypothetical protein
VIAVRGTFLGLPARLCSVSMAAPATNLAHMPHGSDLLLATQDGGQTWTTVQFTGTGAAFLAIGPSEGLWPRRRPLAHERCGTALDSLLGAQLLSCCYLIRSWSW